MPIRPAGPLVWVHAASVGEATVVLALIERLLQTRPSLEILVTTGTVASARLLDDAAAGAGARHQFVPVDLPALGRPVSRPLAARSGDLGRIRAVAQSGADDACPRHSDGAGQRPACRRAPIPAGGGGPGLIGPMLGAFALCLAQDDEQAERLRRLGARQLAGIGDLKAAGAPLPVDQARRQRLRDQIGPRPLWLAASTHPGEEEVAASVHRQLAAKHPGLLTIIAPRHPARGDSDRRDAGNTRAMRRPAYRRRGDHQ